LAKIVQKYPELVKLIHAWPSLPDAIKAAIKVLAQAHYEETK
jgi:hypothetical protein